jgi:hypothetical protein
MSRLPRRQRQPSEHLPRAVTRSAPLPEMLSQVDRPAADIPVISGKAQVPSLVSYTELVMRPNR